MTTRTPRSLASQRHLPSGGGVPPERLIPRAERRRTAGTVRAVSLAFVALAYVLLRSGSVAGEVLGTCVALWSMGGVAFGLKLLLFSPGESAHCRPTHD